MVTTDINIPYPEPSDRHLTIAVAACRLTILPCDDEAWVSGTYVDPIGLLPIHTVQEGGEVRLAQELSAMDISGPFQGLTTLDLRLGKHKPFWLTVESGGSEALIDLGGLPLTRLFVRSGVGHYCIDFSCPNPTALVLFRLTVAAGGIELRNLANANLVELAVEGGVANLQLDMGGTRRRDARIKLATGLSSIDITIPRTMPARCTAGAVLGNAEFGEGWTKRGGDQWTKAGLAGYKPLLSVQANVAIGVLRLHLV